MTAPLKKALLVGPYSGASAKQACLDSLEELKALGETWIRALPNQKSGGRYLYRGGKSGGGASKDAGRGL